MTDTPADSGLAGSLAAFMRIEKIISDNLYHQWEKVEDARLIAREQIGILSALTPATTDNDAAWQKEWPLGLRVTKTKGSSWTGKIVGYYSTELTPKGVAVESENEPGSVQIYPAKALERQP